MSIYSALFKLKMPEYALRGSKSSCIAPRKKFTLTWTKKCSHFNQKMTGSFRSSHEIALEENLPWTSNCLHCTHLQYCSASASYVSHPSWPHRLHTLLTLRAMFAALWSRQTPSNGSGVAYQTRNATKSMWMGHLLAIPTTPTSTVVA